MYRGELGFDGSSLTPAEILAAIRTTQPPYIIIRQPYTFPKPHRIRDVGGRGLRIALNLIKANDTDDGFAFVDYRDPKLIEVAYSDHFTAEALRWVGRSEMLKRCRDNSVRAYIKLTEAVEVIQALPLAEINNHGFPNFTYLLGRFRETFVGRSLGDLYLNPVLKRELSFEEILAMSPGIEVMKIDDLNPQKIEDSVEDPDYTEEKGSGLNPADTYTLATLLLIRNLSGNPQSGQGNEDKEVLEKIVEDFASRSKQEDGLRATRRGWYSLVARLPDLLAPDPSDKTLGEPVCQVLDIYRRNISQDGIKLLTQPLIKVGNLYKLIA